MLKILDLPPETTDEQLAKTVKRLTKLERLALVGTLTKVTDAGLEHLKGLTNLEGLWLDHTKVTDADVARLKQALPDCQILVTR